MTLTTGSSTMALTGTEDIDTLLKDLGDCGLFQLLMVLAVHGAGLPMTWSMVAMVQASYDPGWTCMDTETDTGMDATHNKGHNSTGIFNVVGASESASTFTFTKASLLRNFTSLSSSASSSSSLSSSCDIYNHCEHVVFSKDSSTIVTEWKLACGESWVTSMTITVDMAGQIIGMFGAGVLNDKMGRKATHFLSVGLHATLNLVAAFSVSWPMFTAMRFLIGVTTGSISVTNFVYTLEFVTDKWRTVVSALPFSNLGSLMFAVAALVLRDWRFLHLATAVVTFVLFLPVFWMPESIRWLVVKGQTEKAIEVVRKIERTNVKKARNYDVIHSLSKNEIQRMKGAKNKSILDLFRHGFWKRTIIITCSWIRVTLCLTIITFGLGAMSGDFYTNFILCNSMLTLFAPLVSPMTHLLGRKRTGIILSLSATASCVALVVLDFLTLDSDKGLAVLILSLVFIVIVDGEFALVMLLCVELYPTDVRSLSYGYASCVAKLGGMVAPLLIPHDEESLFIAHAVMAALLLINLAAIFHLPETKGRPLEDYTALEEDK